MGYIYKIVNQRNGKIYVGKTKSTISQRWRNHVLTALARGDSPMAIHSAIRAYGQASFNVVELEHVSASENLGARERAWIRFLGSMAPSGYNLTPGGDGFTGPFSDEHRQKLREATKASWTKSDIASSRTAAIRGTRSSEESRSKTSQASKSLWRSPEHRSRMSKTAAESWKNSAVRERRIRGIRRMANKDEFELAAAKRKSSKFRCGHVATFENSYLDSLGYLHCRDCRLAASRRCKHDA
jgi:group I intron endonuclease